MMENLENFNIGNVLHYLNPTTWYNFLDEGSRDLMVYFADSCSMGMGMSIVLTSIIVKGLWTPFLWYGQHNSIKI